MFAQRRPIWSTTIGPLLIAIIVAIATISHQTDAALSAPEKIVNFTRRYITNFVNSDQDRDLTWVLTDDLVAQKNKSATGDDLLDNVTNSLTATQYSKLAEFVVCLYPKFGSKNAIMETLDKALSVISRAVNNFHLQLLQKVASMNAVGRGINAKYLQVCRMVAQFLTQPNVCTIMQAVKNNWTQTEWDNFRQCVDDGTVHWTNCGQ